MSRCFSSLRLVYKEHLNKVLKSPPGPEVLRKCSPHGPQSVVHIVYRMRNWHKKVDLCRGTLRENLRFLPTVPRSTSIGQSMFSSQNKENSCSLGWPDTLSPASVPRAPETRGTNHTDSGERALCLQLASAATRWRTGFLLRRTAHRPFISSPAQYLIHS